MSLRAATIEAITAMIDNIDVCEDDKPILDQAKGLLEQVASRDVEIDPLSHVDTLVNETLNLLKPLSGVEMPRILVEGLLELNRLCNTLSFITGALLLKQAQEEFDPVGETSDPA